MVVFLYCGEVGTGPLRTLLELSLGNRCKSSTVCKIEMESRRRFASRSTSRSRSPPLRDGDKWKASKGRGKRFRSRSPENHADGAVDHVQALAKGAAASAFFI